MTDSNPSATKLRDGILVARLATGQTVADALSRLLQSVAEDGPPAPVQPGRYDARHLAAVLAFAEWCDSEPLPIATHPA